MPGANNLRGTLKHGRATSSFRNVANKRRPSREPWVWLRGKSSRSSNTTNSGHTSSRQLPPSSPHSFFIFFIFPSARRLNNTSQVTEREAVNENVTEGGNSDRKAFDVDSPATTRPLIWRTAADWKTRRELRQRHYSAEHHGRLNSLSALTRIKLVSYFVF